MIVNTNRFQLTLKLSQVQKMEHNTQQFQRERPRKVPRCCSFFCQEMWFNFGDSFAEWDNMKRCEKLKSTTGKGVQKTPTMKILPRSFGISLSYSFFSFRQKVRFNFGDSVAKGIKVKRWKKQT